MSELLKEFFARRDERQTSEELPPAHDFPEPGSRLDIVIKTLLASPKLSLTNRVIVEREALSELIGYVLVEGRTKAEAPIPNE